MNRYFRYISIFAAALLVSCAIREQIGPEGNTASDIVEGAVPMTFSASFGALSKTSVSKEEDGSLKCEWVAGDQIRILCLNEDGGCVSVIASAEQSGKTSSFAATLPPSGAYYAVYPASCAEAGALASDGSLKVNVPASGMDGTFASASICVAKTDQSKNFSFRSAASMVKFTLAVDASSVSIANVAGGALAGEIIASFDEENNLSVMKGENLVPVAVTSKLLAGDNYIAVIPGTYDKSVAVRFDASSPAYFDNGSVDFNVAHIVSLGNVGEKAIQDYCITADGTGDGSSWENPGNAATVFNALHRSRVDESAHTTLMRIWKNQGATFHFAAGEYVFGSDANKDGLNVDYISFDDYSFLSNTDYKSTPVEPACTERVRLAFLGGYPAGGGERNPGIHESVLSGAGKYRIIAIRDLVDATFDGLTFADATASNATVANASYTTSGKVALSRGSDICGSALYLSDFWENNATWKTIEAVTRPHVDISNCVFRNNSNSKNNAYGGSKSCIAVSKGRCHVTDSRFINNTSISHGIVGGCGGAGYVENANRGELFFDACLFDGNRSSADESATVNATVCYNSSKGTYTCFNNCTFKENNDPDGYTDYGVIFVNRNVLVSNSTFVETVPLNNYNTSASTSTRKLAVIGISGNVLGCREHTLINNIIIDNGANEQKVAVYLKNDDSGILTGTGGPDRDAILLSGGGNILTGYYNFYYTAASGVSYGKHAFVTNRDRNDEALTADNLGLVWSEDDGVYEWSGELKNFVPLSASNVITAMGSNSDIGDLFVNWLSDNKRLNTDALGTNRGDSWTPGAYQAN